MNRVDMPRRAGATTPGRPPWLWLRPPPRATASAGWALLPLRLFLGFTFCFAGLQKLANPGFLTASNPASIQAQLAGAARNSPIHGLIVHLQGVAVPLGVVIALGELAVGLGTLLGLWSRIAAAGGLALSFGLFLTISYHSSPYYTGSDIVFVFAWVPLVVAGSGGVLSVDGYAANYLRWRQGLATALTVPVEFSRVQSVCGAFEHGACRARRGDPCEPGPCPYLAAGTATTTPAQADVLSRRTVALKGIAAAAVGALGVLLGGVAAGFGRLAGGGHSPSGTTPTLGSGSGPTSAPTTAAPATSAPGASTTTTRVPTPTGTRLGPASQVPVGGAAQFTDPATSDPALAVQPVKGTFEAFDAVCPHAGCTVNYVEAAQRFICPCHGSQFNGRTGAVEVGPATRGLRQIPIAEGPDGDLYAV